MKYPSLILRLLLSVAFLTAGSQKLIGAEMMVAVYNQIGIGQWFRLLTGVVEVVAVILLWLPSMQILGALLLGGTMVGAVLAHILILGPSSEPAIILGLLSARCLSLSHACRNAISVMGKGASLVVLTDNNILKALSLKGTRLDEPFLVMGKKTDFFSSSICSQRRPRISPRLMPVSIAMTIIGQRYHEREALAASSNLSYSPILRRLSLGGLFFGILK